MQITPQVRFFVRWVAPLLAILTVAAFLTRFGPVVLLPAGLLFGGLCALYYRREIAGLTGAKVRALVLDTFIPAALNFGLLFLIVMAFRAVFIG